MSFQENAFEAIGHLPLFFGKVAALARAIETDLVFLDLSCSAPVSSEHFGVVEAAVFCVGTDGSGKGYHSLVNPECPFDEMTSRALSLSTKDVINFEPWSRRFSPFIDNVVKEGFCVLAFDAQKDLVPHLTRVQVQSGAEHAVEGLYSCDLRKLYGRVHGGDSTGTPAHLARELGTRTWDSLPACPRSVLTQLEFANRLIGAYGVETVANCLA